MSKIIHKFLLAGNGPTPKTDLKQPGIRYSACESFTKNKDKIQTFKETGDSKHNYQDKLGKACFQCNITGIFKDLRKKQPLIKAFRVKTFEIDSNFKVSLILRELCFNDLQVF